MCNREAEHRRESREGHNGESGREHQDSAANQRLAGTDSQLAAWRQGPLQGRPQQHRGACCFPLRFSRVIVNNKQQQRLLFLAAQGWIKSTCTCKHIKAILRTNTSASVLIMLQMYFSNRWQSGKRVGMFNFFSCFYLSS